MTIKDSEPEWLKDAAAEFVIHPAAPEVRLPASNNGNGVHGYIEAALADEIAKVRNAVEGTRNHQLNIAAVKLGGYVAAGALDEKRLISELYSAATAAGLTETETLKTITSGLDHGLLRPSVVPEQRSGEIQIGASATQIRDWQKGLDPTGQGGIVVPPTPAGPKLRASFASEVTMQRVRWLWHDRIPIGEITLIAGREGIGKSIYLADLAAKITRGTALGEYEGEPRTVIYLASEDSWSYTVAPRMAAAGADLTKIANIVPVEDDGTGLLLPDNCEELADMALDLKAAAIMCDPIISLIHGALSTDRARELRKALEPLRRAAERAKCAVPALVHFNKRDGDVLTKIAGSRGWAEVARAAIGLVRDKDNGYCVLSQIKNNLGRLDLANHSYQIVSVSVETIDGPSDVGKIEWLGKVEMGVEDLMEQGTKQDGKRGPKTGDNTNAVIDLINANGQVSVQDVILALPDLSDSVIRRALATATDKGAIRWVARGIYGRVEGQV